jgi:hypothetical protein
MAKREAEEEVFQHLGRRRGLRNKQGRVYNERAVRRVVKFYAALLLDDSNVHPLCGMHMRRPCWTTERVWKV